MAQKSNAYRVLFENLLERENFKDLGVGRSLILKWIFK